MQEYKRCYWDNIFNNSLIKKNAGTVSSLQTQFRNIYNFHLASFWTFWISNFKFHTQFFFYIWNTIILINLDFIQFYQFSIKTDLIDKKLSIMSIDDISIICKKGHIFIVHKSNDGWNKLFNNYNLIEIFNSINSSFKNLFNLLFHKHILNLKGIKISVENKIRSFHFL